MNVSVNEPFLNGNEKKYLNECIDTGWISFEGPFVDKFEHNMASRVGRTYAVAVSSGSAALETVILALNLHAGDEVILPTFTIISCILPLVRSGIKPVLVDSDSQTWNMNVEDIERKVSKKTRAILAVHLYGLPIDMNPLLEIADKYGLYVIEDAAEMHGQTYYGKPCGSFGNISIFSFYPNKNVTCGEGGMILTDDGELANRCRQAANLFFGKKRYVHNEMGYNFRMSNLQAAVGCAQLENLSITVTGKRRMGENYNNMLKDVSHLQLPLKGTPYAENIYWVYGLVLDDAIQADADYIIHKLASVGVGSRNFFWCMHEQPVFKKMRLFEGESYPNAERLARRGFYIPSGLTLKYEEQDYVASCVKQIVSDIS